MKIPGIFARSVNYKLIEKLDAITYRPYGLFTNTDPISSKYYLILMALDYDWPVQDGLEISPKTLEKSGDVIRCWEVEGKEDKQIKLNYIKSEYQRTKNASKK